MQCIKEFQKYTNKWGISLTIKSTKLTRLCGSPCTFKFMFEWSTIEFKKVPPLLRFSKMGQKLYFKSGFHYVYVINILTHKKRIKFHTILFLYN